MNDPKVHTITDKIIEQENFGARKPLWCSEENLSSENIILNGSVITDLLKVFHISGLGEKEKYDYNVEIFDRFKNFIKVDVSCICNNFKNLKFKKETDTSLVRYIEDSDIYLVVKKYETEISEKIEIILTNIDNKITKSNESYHKFLISNGNMLTVNMNRNENDTIISYILNIFSYEAKVELNTHIYDTFYCNKILYNIFGFGNRNTLESYMKITDFNFTFVNSALKKVFSKLRYLKNSTILFNHNNLTIDKISVHEESNNRFKFMLTNFSDASIFYKGVKIQRDEIPEVNEDEYVTIDKNLKNGTITILISKYLTEVESDINIVVSYIKNNKFFIDTLDYYVFFMSVILHPKVLSMIEFEKDNFKLLKLMFPVLSDRKTIISTIQNLKKRSISENFKIYKFKEILNLLMGKPMLINMTPIFNYFL